MSNQLIFPGSRGDLGGGTLASQSLYIRLHIRSKKNMRKQLLFRASEIIVWAFLTIMKYSVLVVCEIYE